MELDFDDFNEDKIKKFLQSKLQEICLQNKDLEQVLSECQNAVKESQDENNMDHLDIKLSVPWKKIFEGKYVLGFTLEANSNEIQDISVNLKWDSPQSFKYDVLIFSKDADTNDHCDYECTILEPVYKNIIKENLILVTFNIPDFIDKTEYKIYGIVSYKIANKIMDILVPKISISASDFVSHKLQDWVVKKLDFDSLLSIISCSNKMELVMVFPEEWNLSIDSTFEIHCSLTKIDQKFSCKDFFVAYKVSQVFDNALLSVHTSGTNVYFVNIYATSNKKLLAFVHYLHSCIVNLKIFPKIYYKNYEMKNTAFCTELLQKFRESLTKEMDFVEDNKFESGQSDKINNSRKVLCDMEYHTDELYTKLCNMNY